tara:strand:+ start:1342 stop:3249 length:1908 start_codon:yes stop_codon:yes gene_type:complete
MALVNFSNLDFDQIKTQVKSYLRTNSDFTDFDFDGSNFSILLDTLAYNTYISAYNANMLSNEVFIDGATLRENVVSLARNVGYMPRSNVAAKAKISFFISTSTLVKNPTTITLRKGIVATSASNFGKQSYTFSIPEDIIVPVSGGIASFDAIGVYEGIYLTETYTYNSLNKDQRFILNNTNIDTSLLRIEVRESKESSITRKYKYVNNISELDSSDDVFFLNEIEDQRYEIFFGDGIFGRKLQDDNYIIASYIVTASEEANGISEFTFVGRLHDNDGNIVKVSSPIVTADESSGGGTSIETVASVKKFAPRVYASQNRAVTATDYETILPQIFPETESVAVFGGEELTPPKFGKVYITVKPRNGTYLPNNIKDNLKIALKKYAVAGILPEFIDLKYLYVEYQSSVYYNENLGSAQQLKTTITNNINKYSASTDLNKYGSRFKYSKFLKMLDDSDRAITSNITMVNMRRDLKVLINEVAEYEICFGNEFHIKNAAGYNFKTSGVSVSGITGTVYFSDIPDPNLLTGTVIIFKLDAAQTPIVVRQNAGKIDYKKGEVTINALNITATTKKASGDQIIEVSAIPKSNDIIGKQDLYLQLSSSSSSITMVSDTISSGAELSGSGYIVSSSYTDEEYVRL